MLSKKCVHCNGVGHYRERVVSDVAKPTVFEGSCPHTIPTASYKLVECQLCNGTGKDIGISKCLKCKGVGWLPEGKCSDCGGTGCG